MIATQLHLKHLRLIAAIAQHRQVSIAAQTLGITQPAASRTLAEAEAMVGVPLFERHPKGMFLTDAGEGLARRARNILDELNDAADEVDRLRLGRGGIVRIGAVTGAAVGYVVPAIRALKTQSPGAEVHVDVATSEELIGGLLALRHDMILGRVQLRTAPDGLSMQRARGERVQIVASADHPAAGQDKVSLVDLVGADWVMQGPGAPIRRAVEEAFLNLGAPLPGNVTNTASLLMALALLPTAVALGLDERMLRGVSVWMKPLKFMASTALFLGEPLPPWKLLAAALIIGGLALNLLATRQPAMRKL